MCLNASGKMDPNLQTILQVLGSIKPSDKLWVRFEPRLAVEKCEWCFLIQPLHRTLINMSSSDYIGTFESTVLFYKKVLVQCEQFIFQQVKAIPTNTQHGRGRFVLALLVHTKTQLMDMQAGIATLMETYKNEDMEEMGNIAADLDKLTQLLCTYRAVPFVKS